MPLMAYILLLVKRQEIPFRMAYVDTPKDLRLHSLNFGSKKYVRQEVRKLSYVSQP